MTRKILFTFFFITGCLSFLHAQDKKNRKDSTVVVIFNENKTSGKTGKHKKSGEENIIKIAPLGLISGTYPLLYERVVSDFFTVQAGGGLTGKNFFRSAVQKSGNSITIDYPWPSNSNLTDYTEGLFDWNVRKGSIGYMFTIQPRLYFESEAPSGGFLGVSYDYYHYAFTSPALITGSSGPEQKGAPKSEYENVSDIMVHYGYQNVYDRLTLEYTAAVGLRNVKGSKYVASYDGTSVGPEGFASYKQNVFNFGIGFKVGYHF